MRTTFSGARFTQGLVMLGWATARVAGRIAALPDMFYDWRRRSRTRHQLMAMDNRMLKDMGISRYDALHEGGKPFWKE